MILQKQGANNQFFVYIPLAIVEAMGWKKGMVLSCEIVGKGKIKLEEAKDDQNVKVPKGSEAQVQTL
jgi:hypothetical protein